MISTPFSPGASSRRGSAFRIVLRVADLRTLKLRGLDATFVWLAQWLSPSRTDPVGGKNLFVCMTSTKGGKPAFWLGERSGQVLPTNAPGFAYPAEPRVKGSCVRGAPGTITIDLPSKVAYDANPIAKTLYSVTGCTLTLVGSGAVFALADSAPSFDFVP
jgi:hypothetical protein